jgi:hypothetical protein
MSRELGPAPLGRCLIVWLGGTTVLALLTTWLAPDLLAARGALAAEGLGGRPFDQVLVWVCGAALLAAAAWLWVVASVLVGDAARGRHPSRRGVPRCVRRLVLVACGTALAGGLASPAFADPAPTPGRSDPDVVLIRGLPLPDRATAAGHVSRLLARRAAATLLDARPGTAAHAGAHPGRDLRTVTVRPGDTLWGLAGDTLAPDAPPSAVDDRWREIYRLNRGVVGADPDLIRPDQRLRLPRR